ncbi:MAG: family 20 glycosylhydrolase [Clostridiales bacterium]|nr:family 20 glycosylhydrolase [Clostridiales bacterium]
MDIKNLISPVPKQFEYLDGGHVRLGTPGKANWYIESDFTANHPLLETSITSLIDKLTGLLNAPPSNNEGIRILLTVRDPKGNYENIDQGYSIEVSNDTILITGFSEIGLHYGIITFKDCLIFKENQLKIPNMRILDWPDLKTRGHFMESRYGSNLMTLKDWKHVVDHMADMKMNQLVVSVYGCWCVQYDGRVSEYMYVPIKKYPKLKTPVVERYYSAIKKKWIDKERLPPMFEDDFFGDLIAYGKIKGITVFPLVNSYGHNTLIPSMYPDVSALDEDGNPSLTGFCTSNPKTYELLLHIYDELIDNYLLPNNIDSFHVGLDEVWDGLAHNSEDIFKKRSPWCKCPECSRLTRKDLFINHAIRLLKHLKSRGMKNIYMYHDMLIGHGEKETAESTGDMVKALRENDLIDNVIIDWWTYSDYKERLMFDTTRPDLGFRRTVKPWNGYYHWTILTNPLKNIYLLADMGIKEGVEGMQSYSAWDESYDRNHRCQADFAWNFDGAGDIKSVTKRYVRRNFPSKYDEALRAFELIDLITEVRNEKKEDGKPIPSKYSILLHTLSYYFYSYVREGKPYPRIFPGEALSIIYTDRESYLREINEIAAMAREATDLLSIVASDPRCNKRLAERFLYEVENYNCLARDYIALIQMMDISQCHHDNCYDIQVIEKIKYMAKERKLARLQLMARLEDTKEEFLLAGHMRNHTIFMQFFADLEGYLSHTKPESIELDFFDMRYIESEAFRKLR